MKNFCIELENPAHVYISGEKVQGHVVIDTEEPIEVKEITLLLEGVARVHWALTENFKSNEMKIEDSKTNNTPKAPSGLDVYSETEKYVSQRITVAGDHHEPLCLSMGTTSFPFHFVLPPNCPSSFNAKFGHVAYSLEAELKRQIFKRNIKATASITVNGTLDLDTELGAQLPQQMEKIKESNFMVGRSGQVKLVLKLSKSGYVPGEILEFYSNISNHCNKKVNGTKASLIQSIQFQTNLQTKTEKRVICTVNGPELEAGNHVEWKPDSLKIPFLPPTRLGGVCRIIDVQYYIRIEAGISGLSQCLFGELPVMIGTTPVKITTENSQEAEETQTE